MATISAVKVFASTLARDRDVLGERVAEWLRAHPELTPVDVQVRQSSDDEFHCLSITLFLSGDPTAYLASPPPSSFTPRRPPQGA